MFNAANTIRPNPYPQRGQGNYNAGNDGTDKDGHNPQGQERQNQERQQPQVVARGRADEIVQQQPRQAMYSPAKSAYPTAPNYNIQPQSMPATRQIQPQQLTAQQYQAMQNRYPQIPQQQVQPVQSQDQPTQRRSNRVNIAQILKDFRNTMKAIATPREVEDNVNNYLAIVEQKVREPQPQVNLIQSNLKIAASLLDKYISETLNKDSKVVQNWLDALFLQRVDYSYNEEDVNPSFLVQFPENKPIQKEQEPEQQTQQNIIQQDFENQQTQEEIEEYIPQNIEEEFVQAKEKISTKPNITIIPQDTRLKSLFMEAKKQAFSNNPQKAMSMFKEAFNRAGEIKDNETQSRICLEIGKIYDDNDFIVQALTSYNKSLQFTTDTNVKSKAHYSMAQIYDDVNQVEQALNHYITSISYAGKSDDLLGQTDSLTRVGNILTDKYDENAFDYYDVAKKLVDQTNDSNMRGYVLSNTADACVQFKKNDKALKYYAEAVKNYEKTSSREEVAENYKSAAELMINFNSPNKARSLLKKALVNAVKTQNEDLISEINLLLTSVA